MAHRYNTKATDKDHQRSLTIDLIAKRGDSDAQSEHYKKKVSKQSEWTTRAPHRQKGRFMEDEDGDDGRGGQIGSHDRRQLQGASL